MGTFGHYIQNLNMILFLLLTLIYSMLIWFIYEKFLESKCDLALIAVNYKTVVNYAILKEKIIF